MPTTRRRILEALRSRLQAIDPTLPNPLGFETPAGQAVFLYEAPDLGPDDPDVAIAIVPREDGVAWDRKNVSLTLPVEIQAIAKATLDEPWLAAETVLGDIKRAIELEDRTLGGLVRPFLRRGTTVAIPREAGLTIVGVVITYFCDYVERYGNPEVE